ncbi:MAG: ParB N-terminal domain-containing protein [Alphaproteobacteria bacterium]|nr:ParB N-terminal domain-containing protein [Alphaproteobacteria bacterium]
MLIEHIPLSKLKISVCNIRHREPPPDVSDILPSIKERGVLLPLIARPEDGKFGVVAGRRRYFALKAVKQDTGAVDDPPCAIMAEGDDAAAIEASLLENLARRNPEPMTEHLSFVRLIKEGKTVEQIAATFALTATQVRQRLALGNLVPKIRALYTAGEIDDLTVRHLTLASVSQQRKWLRLFADPDQSAPCGAYLRQWLLGGQEISTEVALFPLKDYTGQIIEDLFGKERLFADLDLFWALQNRALAAKRETLLKAGWTAVEVLEIGQRFSPWEHVRTPKKKGGKVFITVSHQGEVEIHDGWLSQKEARKRAKAEDSETRKLSDTVGNDAAVRHPTITQAMQNYLDLHRLAALRLALIAHPDVAFRLAVAHMIAASGNWAVKSDEQRARSEAIRASLANSLAQRAFETAAGAVSALLDLAQDEDIARADEDRTVTVFTCLLALSNEDVLRIATCRMAETVAAGSGVVDAVGAHLAVDASSHWKPDDTFFALVRDRATVGAMLSEVAGPTVARANIAEKTRTQKQIIRDCLAGANGRAQVEWTPGWMAFPFRPVGADGAEAVAPAGNTGDPQPVAARPEAGDTSVAAPV